mmetsp:Transcript_23613/g.46190  ORF Transcript_23613/g.46190 Transcript_23613/m.46190 type:complete len:341 (+) Transcript_23613:1-1023(+)
MEAARRRMEIETEQEQKDVADGKGAPNPLAGDGCIAWDFTTSKKPVGVIKNNDSHYHMRRQGQYYLKVYANASLSLTANIKNEVKGNLGGTRLNAYTLTMEFKFEELPKRKAAPKAKGEAESDAKQAQLTVPTERAIINLNRILTPDQEEMPEALVSIDSDGAIRLGGVQDRRVRITPKKWHFLTLVADCKEKTIQSFVDGIKSTAIDAKSQPSLKLDSGGFSVSPDRFYLFASPRTENMDCEVDVKRVWLYSEKKDESLIGLMNEEFMGRDPWKVGHGAPAKAGGAAPEEHYKTQLQMIKDMFAGGASKDGMPSDETLLAMLKEHNGNVEKVLSQIGLF